ncbi:MAG TPA: putative glycoside hydrolase, partial [Gaiellaceae bacterium]|nr:putative glycoside hydrolase [Gaiellaceae bacterium]
VPVHDGSFSVIVPPPLPATVRLRAVDRAGNASVRRVRVSFVPRRPPEPIRAVHVSFYGWADRGLRSGILSLIATHRINAIEVDLKDESGIVGFGSSVPLAHRIGAAQKIYDLGKLIRQMHARGIRVIGRLVCFRDPVLAAAAWKRGQRDEVIQTPGGAPYAGYGGFTNFANEAVRRYQIDIAVAAAKLGIDDVLYDYVRRPDGPIASMRFPQLHGTPERSIADFLRETRKALQPYGTYVGASVFGVAATRPKEVAQDIPLIARQVDYVAPMVYPSHWGPGEYDVPNPNGQPYLIVRRSLKDFQRDVRDSGARVVPWLQDFSLGVTYGAPQVRAQIDAARADGIREFILWDPAVTYTTGALDTGVPVFPKGSLASPGHSPAAVRRPAIVEPPEPPAAPPPVRPVHGRMPNELGVVPVIMHHEIRPDRVGVYDQTPKEFRRELAELWRGGYWPVRASDYVNGDLGSVPAGKTPVVLTFDDATQYQFRYRHGKIDPTTAIGVLLAFKKAHPRFPLAGTFYVLPQPFAGVGRGPAMLRWLVNHGFELGDHTYDHLPLATLSDRDVQRELVRGLRVITSAVPGYRVQTMALPLGSVPKRRMLALRGRWGGTSYRLRGVMLVGAGPAPSPYSASFDPAAIPRIRSSHLPWHGEVDYCWEFWRHQLAKEKGALYVSDGDPATIAVPRAERAKVAKRFTSLLRTY